jgi:hypothetical protein
VSYDANPFSVTDEDRHAIWEAVVRRDIDAFLAQDWSLCADDFHAEHFMGIDAGGSDDPDGWRLTYPTLEAYRDDWLRQAAVFAGHRYRDDPREVLFRATRLDEIEIRGESAILHKKFDGAIGREDGTMDPIVWQTIYRMCRIDGRWKLTGFIGYLPNPMPKNTDSK